MERHAPSGSVSSGSDCILNGRKTQDSAMFLGETGSHSPFRMLCHSHAAAFGAVRRKQGNLTFTLPYRQDQTVPQAAVKEFLSPPVTEYRCQGTGIFRLRMLLTPCQKPLPVHDMGSNKVRAFLLICVKQNISLLQQKTGRRIRAADGSLS